MTQTKPTILIADDVPLNIEILRAALGPDYETIAATSGYDALDAARDQLPDLLLLDVLMLDMDGYEVCRRLQDDPRTQRIPVIFVTAMDRDEEEQQGLDAGGIDYLGKPAKPYKVRARVRTALELHRLREQVRDAALADPLTGVLGAERFAERLAEAWHRAARNGAALALALVGLDACAAWQERWGELAADGLWVRLARALTAAAPDGCVARLDPDRFAVLVAGDHETLATQLHAALDDLHLPGPAEGACLTARVAAATALPQPDREAAELLAAAERVLGELPPGGAHGARAW